MYLWEGVMLAMSQIWTEKLKSFFSVLGVVIGVMFLITVVSVVEGMDQYIRDDFSSKVFGINTITLARRPSIQINTSREQRRAWNRRPRLRYEDAEAFRTRLVTPAQVGVWSNASGEIQSQFGDKVENVWISGVSVEMLEIRNLVVERGRPFSALEAEQGVPVVLLGYSTAEVLFKGLDPVGKRVRIRGYPYRVIGVFEEQGSVLGFSQDNIAVAPSTSPIRSFTNPRGVVDQVVIQVDNPDQLREAQAEAEVIMRSRRMLRPRDENNFVLETADQSLAFWDNISRVLFTALPGLVAISLVVGGIVIMNIMLVSVMERTREIGVRKAIGARSADILVQVLIESATLSGTGAAIGAFVGIGLAGVVAAVSPLPAAVAPKWIILGVVLGVVVGIVSGVYPATRAAKLNPVDALRHE